MIKYLRMCAESQVAIYDPEFKRPTRKPGARSSSSPASPDRAGRRKQPPTPLVRVDRKEVARCWPNERCRQVMEELMKDPTELEAGDLQR